MQIDLFINQTGLALLVEIIAEDLCLGQETIKRSICLNQLANTIYPYQTFEVSIPRKLE